jgi:hypothetical protein
MQRFVVGNYTCTISSIFVQIAIRSGENYEYIRCINDQENPEDDTFFISRVDPSHLNVETKHFRLLLKYYDDEPAESNGRIELYYRADEDDEFLSSVFMKVNIPQETVSSLMNFIEYHEDAVNDPVANLDQNQYASNNDYNNNNDPPTPGSARRRRRNRKTRKYTRRG